MHYKSFKDYLKEEELDKDIIFKKSDRKSDGISKKSSIETTYYELEKIFGKPTNIYNKETGDRTHIEWVLEDKDKNIATIYDYKESINPLDKKDKKIDWSIGAMKGIVALNLLEYIKNKI